MKRYGIGIVIVAAAGLAAAAALAAPRGAQGRGEGRGGMQGRGRMQGGPQGAGPERLLQAALNNPEVVEQLGLSEEQVAALRKALHAHQLAMIDAEAELHKAQLERAYLMRQETVDEAKLMAAIEKAGAKQVELEKTRARMLLTVRKTLTKEQQEKAQELLREHMRKRAEAREGEQLGDQPDRPGGPGGEGMQEQRQRRMERVRKMRGRLDDAGVEE
ncbi:MAG: periplasmic heavy metal sensor [Kiritimatiellae bacterium]|nr:periplasmic heavy metal sensor [Kiritimatiellia bacterium]